MPISLVISLAIEPVRGKLGRHAATTEHDIPQLRCSLRAGKHEGESDNGYVLCVIPSVDRHERWRLRGH